MLSYSAGRAASGNLSDCGEGMVHAATTPQGPLPASSRSSGIAASTRMTRGNTT